MNHMKKKKINKDTNRKGEPKSDSRNKASGGKRKSASGTHRGQIEITRSGMGYVTVTDMEKDIIVRPQHFNTALHGDKVEVEVTKSGSAGRLEGMITKIVSRKQTEFIGHISVQKNHTFFIPETDRPMPDLYIPADKINGAENGDKAVVRLTAWEKSKRVPEGEVVEDIQVVSTGSLGLDVALGVGGLPRGRVIEIYGPESSGKTTLTLQVIAEMQKLGGTCAFVDAEHALDTQYAQALGVNLQDMLISQPDTGEQALEIVDSLVRSGAVDLIVVDSVAALTPKAELEGEMGDSLPGLQARLMSQALRKLTATIKKANCMVIFINQIRMKIGVMFGSPETTTGGNALKFYASVRLDIRRTGTIKKGEDSIGNETKVKVVKNKVAPPFKTAEFDIMFGEGISRHGEIIDLGVQHRIVEKSGAWYAYNGEKIGQGRDNAREFLKENPDLSVEIENKVRTALGVPLLPVKGPSAADKAAAKAADKAAKEAAKEAEKAEKLAAKASKAAPASKEPEVAAE